MDVRTAGNFYILILEFCVRGHFFPKAPLVRRYKKFVATQSLYSVYPMANADQFDD